MGFYYIQKALDDNIIFKVAKENTCKEAWDIPKVEFDIKGNNPTVYQAQSQIQVPIVGDATKTKIKEDVFNVEMKNWLLKHKVMRKKMMKIFYVQR